MLYAVLMYPLAYFYLRGVMFPQSYPDWGMPVFAALFIVYVDCAARAAHRTAAKETPLWAACWMALAAAYPLYGYQPGPLGDWQWPAWHLFAVWYVLARCGMLAQGQSGSLAPLDALAGFVLLPFGNFFLRARTVFAALRTHLQDRTGTRKVSAPHRYRSGDDGAVRCGMGPAGSGRCQLCRAGAAGVRLVEQAAEQYEIH